MWGGEGAQRPLALATQRRPLSAADAGALVLYYYDFLFGANFG